MNYDPSRAEALFHAAAEIVAPGERALFLQRECAGDDALRARVKTLLASHDQATRFLDPAASSPELEAEFARLKPEESGERIAHYKRGSCKTSAVRGRDAFTPLSDDAARR